MNRIRKWRREDLFEPEVKEGDTPRVTMSGIVTDSLPVPGSPGSPGDAADQRSSAEEEVRNLQRWSLRRDWRTQEDRKFTPLPLIRGSDPNLNSTAARSLHPPARPWHERLETVVRPSASPVYEEMLPLRPSWMRHEEREEVGDPGVDPREAIPELRGKRQVVDYDDEAPLTWTADGSVGKSCL